MRQLLPPTEGLLDPTDPYAGAERPVPAGRPWVLVNMVATADGATAVAGRSGPIGGPADRAVFDSLRAAADVVLVGAATARAENYGPAKSRPDGTTGPRIAVVTRSGDLDPGARLFAGGEPLVLTCAACPPGRRSALAEVAEVVVAGDDDVDLPLALAALAEREMRVALCEGGPSLNGQLVAADLVDEWCLTLSPLLAGGDAKRPAVGRPAPGGIVALRLDRVLEADGLLFLRYLRARG